MNNCLRSMARMSLCALTLTSLVWAQPTYQVAPSGSHVGFSIRNFISQTPGEFKAYDGTLQFSAAHPETSKVTFEVDVASIDTDIDKRDEHLRSDDYFGAKAHPKMTFESVAFKSVGPHRYLVTGPLTIKGHSKDISIFVDLERNTQLWNVPSDSLLFTTEFDIDRTEFGVGEPMAVLGSEVHIRLRLDFRNKS